MWADGKTMENVDYHDSYLEIVEVERMLIQSDKAKYKPGNLVQFRILTIDQDLKPLDAEVTYQIKSPEANVMGQATVKVIDGVFAGKFQLDAYAEQGIWKMEVNN